MLRNNSMHLPIVGDSNNGSLKLVKKLLKPGNTLRIEVVRRLER